MRNEDRTCVGRTRAAAVIAAIVNVRTRQLELQLQASRCRGGLVGERLYRAGELSALLADLRAELGASEHETRGLAGREPDRRDS